MTIVKTLKALYERLGGTPSDVADATRAVDVLNAIAALYDGTDDATRITKAIANIAAVASGLIKPSGTKSITANGSGIDVKEYAAVDVSVPQPSGTISITANGTGIDVANYATANVNISSYKSELEELVQRQPHEDGYNFQYLNITDIGDYCCYNWTGLKWALFPIHLVTIGSYAFAGSGLTVIQFNIPLLRIEDHAFYQCTGITEVRLEDYLNFLGESAFGGCTGLTNVVININNTVLHKIGASAFAGCTSLATVTIPAIVTEFGTNAFNSTALTDIYYTGTQQQWEAITGLSGAGIPQGCTIHYEYTPS